jgi:hypothetical protein
MISSTPVSTVVSLSFLVPFQLTAKADINQLLRAVILPTLPLMVRYMHDSKQDWRKQKTGRALFASNSWNIYFVVGETEALYDKSR